MLDIHRIMKSLATRRPVFHSESDFQFALAWQIHESIPNCEVRLEFKPFPDESMYLDIWLPTAETAIELKYLTRNLDVEYGGERFTLASGARDIESYDSRTATHARLGEVRLQPHKGLRQIQAVHVLRYVSDRCAVLRVANA